MRGPLAFVVTCVAATTMACAAPPATEPPRLPPPQVDLPPPPPAPLLSPARWVMGGGVTAVGPESAAGTLVLLGGRRALVASDGKVTSETAPCPEPLVELSYVPASGGAMRLVGRGKYGIYRFDDPLGAPTILARSAAPLRKLGAGPDLVAIWDTQSDLPRFLDIETGKLRDFAGLPPLPATAMAFVDDKRGAAIFHVAGLATTVDGGATFHPVASAAGDGLRVTGLRVGASGADRKVRAFVYAEGREAAIDLAGASLGAMEEVEAPRSDPPLLRWIRVTGRDPIEAAVTSGALSTETIATVASHGLLARVDVASGTIVDLAEFGTGSGMNTCAVSRAGAAAYVACALSEQSEGDLYDPFGVFTLPTQGKLEIERPLIARNGEARLRTSPSGGAMLLGPCDADEQGDACVRQPDGRWITFAIDIDLIERGAGPLADGRIAFLRGLYDGDDAPEGNHATEHGAAWPAPYVVAMRQDGVEQWVSGSRWTGRTSGDFSVESFVQEAADRALHFALTNEEGAFVFIEPQGSATGVAKRVEGASRIRLRGNRGVAIGQGRLSATLDGGGTWINVDPPPVETDETWGIEEDLDGREGIIVSDVGARIGGLLRVGWGASEDPPRSDIDDRAPLLDARPVPPSSSSSDRTLVCKTGGKTEGAVYALEVARIKDVLASSTKAPTGSRRNLTLSTGSRMLEATGTLEEQGPDKRGADPTSWTLRWHDPLEIGGSVHTWSGAPPKGTAWGAVLRSVASSGSRALFAIKTGGSFVLARTNGRAPIETAAVRYEMLPSGDVVFGADKTAPIAWLHDTSVVVWRAGQAPEIASDLATGAFRMLGEPTKDALPIVVGGPEWSLTRDLAFAPASSASATPAPSILDRWAPSANLRRDAGRLLPCDAKDKGSLFSATRTALDITVDGVTFPSPLIEYRLRVTGERACVASLAALVSPEPRGKPKGEPASKGPKALRFLRADLQKNRAEGSEASPPEPVSARKLTCSLVAKP